MSCRKTQIQHGLGKSCDESGQIKILETSELKDVSGKKDYFWL